nr:hypothetical protein [Gammaproteobacteria bacterium]
GYKKLTKGIRMFSLVIEAAPMANTVLDPVAGVTGMAVGAVTERLCDYGLLSSKQKKRHNGTVADTKRSHRSSKKTR